MSSHHHHPYLDTRPPRRVDDSTAIAHEFVTPEDYFRKQYFEVLDLLINKLK